MSNNSKLVKQVSSNLKQCNRNGISEKDIKIVLDLIAEKQEVQKQADIKMDIINKKIQSTDMYIFNGGAYCEILAMLQDTNIQ